MSVVLPAFSTGPSAAANYDANPAGRVSTIDVGFATGRLAVTGSPAPPAPLVRFAQPFTLAGVEGDDSVWTIRELHVSGCVPGISDCVAACSPSGDDCAPEFASNATLGFTIWTRVATLAPQNGDEVAIGTVKFPIGKQLVDSAPENEDFAIVLETPLVLPAGDYYLAVYADGFGDGGAAAALTWFTNSPFGDAVPLLDERGQPFVYRDNGIADSSFVPYALPSQLSQQEALDPDKLYAQAFAVVGSITPDCARVKTKVQQARLKLARAGSQGGMLEPGGSMGFGMLSEEMAAQIAKANALLALALKQLPPSTGGGGVAGGCPEFDLIRVRMKLEEVLLLVAPMFPIMVDLLNDDCVTEEELALALEMLNPLLEEAIQLLELIEQQINNCQSDLNSDGAVDAADLGVLFGSWGESGFGDLDEDGSIGPMDLGILLGDWGPCPDPG
ncbi:MAG: hypothetical protein SGJ09_12020 [Phycisphaerae bacterium]|nr:hypothetical protein [Phycisphaerae bacterium]